MLATVKLPGIAQGKLRYFGVFLVEWLYGYLQFSGMR
ncbi:hypothetical protein PSE_4397 [Pseudovibrio sp. FO-BEG1]|nr:hypothetical protein PSE_4397 [Pseudovibrio sp. FO-BEG1]